MSEFTEAELTRYSRHLALPGVGIRGQEALSESSVLIVGVGGLGTPAALYLAAAGVGRIGLVDFDSVDLSNLQRQVLYGTGDVGRPKVEVAAERLRQLNPEIEIETYQERVSSANARHLVSDFDIVLDGTDNFPTRYLVNDACVHEGKPNVYGSVFQFEGQVSVFGVEGGPCYRCLFPSPPPPDSVPDCAEGGVLGVLPGVIGTIQATETLKLILGIGEPLVGRLLVYDAIAQSVQEVKVERDPLCPICAERTIAPQESQCLFPEITAAQLFEVLGKRDFLLIDVREIEEHEDEHIPGSQNIPLSHVIEGIRDVPQDKEIVFYCQVGVRSQYAVQMAESFGWSNTWNLVGGIVAWKRELSQKV